MPFGTMPAQASTVTARGGFTGGSFQGLSAVTALALGLRGSFGFE
jgi:hypothetical protein